ncbi:hypothetical protein [Sphingomonas bacterium]|uniref:hypothetical protein n=1 Tax=Sphingomonas bacterium TaxID=1895847 RepID=UPI001576B3D1|nr:hypothetical protein [Sphingomonas bacterium]
MATVLDRPVAQAKPISADRLERVLGYAAVLLLAAVMVALARGYGQWRLVPALIWAHLLTIIVALALTPVILLRRRGDRRHRTLGQIWVAAMIATAVLSLFVHESGPGRFSVIHIISVWVLIQVPLIWWTARTHRVVRHRRGVRGLVIGSLLIAGFFTFPFDRLLGHWLFG